MSHDGRTALVTGANRGLGRALVAGLAAERWCVTAAARDPAATVPGAARVLAHDQGVAASADAVGRAMAGEGLDLLVLNAAIRGDTGGIPALTQPDLLAVMAVNLAGPLLLFRALLPCLRPGAKVAFISSTSGSMTEGHDPDGDYAYCCSKAALNRAAVKLADDFPALVFLALHPGWVRTDMGGPDARLGADASAAGLMRVIEAAGPADSGSFRAWNGVSVGW